MAQKQQKKQEIIQKNDEIVEKEPEKTLTRHEIVQQEMRDFIKSMTGKHAMTHEEAVRFCNLYNELTGTDPRTSDCRPNCSICIINKWNIVPHYL